MEDLRNPIVIKPEDLHHSDPTHYLSSSPKTMFHQLHNQRPEVMVITKVPRQNANNHLEVPSWRIL